MARPFFLTRYCIPVLIQSHGFKIESPDGTRRRDAGRQFDCPLNISEAAAGNGNSVGSDDGAVAEAPGDKRKVNGQRDGRQRQRRADDDRLRLARRLRVASIRRADSLSPRRWDVAAVAEGPRSGVQWSIRTGVIETGACAPLASAVAAGTALRAWSSRSTVRLLATLESSLRRSRNASRGRAPSPAQSPWPPQEEFAD